MSFSWKPSISGVLTWEWPFARTSTTMSATVGKYGILFFIYLYRAVGKFLFFNLLLFFLVIMFIFDEEKLLS